MKLMFFYQHFIVHLKEVYVINLSLYYMPTSQAGNNCLLKIKETCKSHELTFISLGNLYP
jgi:hypothetical protein